MLNRVISFNFSLKEVTLKLLILYSILAKITTSSNSILEVNTNTTFCFAFIGYLYIGEILYTNK